MKKKTMILATTVIVTAFSLSSCSSPGQKVRNAEQNVQDSKQDVKDSKQDVMEAKRDLAETQQEVNDDFAKFKSESNAEIAENEKKIADLRVGLKSQSADVRAKNETKIDGLEKTNRDLKAKLDGYQNDGKSDWQVFKSEFRHDMNGLGQAFKDIAENNIR